jgi:hypothetical protein
VTTYCLLSVACTLSNSAPTPAGSSAMADVPPVSLAISESTRKPSFSTPIANRAPPMFSTDAWARSLDNADTVSAPSEKTITLGWKVASSKREEARTIPS